MRAISILFILTIISLTGIIAQDFRLFVPGQDKLYFKEGNKIYSPEFTNITLNDSTTNIRFDGLPMFDIFNNCYENIYNDIFSIMLSSFDIEGISGYLMITGFQAPYFQIRTNTKVGESWDCHYHYGQTYMVATCKSIETAVVNGKSQLVMTIGFTGDYCDMKISQYDGIISTPTWNRNLDLHWWGWMNLDYGYAECVERIWDTALLNKFNTPFGDLASDLEGGDELHIQEFHENSKDNWTKKDIKSTFINSEFDPDINSYRLNFRDEILQTTNIEGQIREITYVDSNILTIGKDMPDDHYTVDYPLPINRVHMNPGLGEIITYSLFNNRLSFGKQRENPAFSESSQCFLHDEENNCRHEYIEGLAGPYFSCNAPLRKERILKYYKKGSEEWGDPFTFTVSTSEKISSESVSIYPNPVAAGSQIYLQDHGGKETLEIQLVDIHGKLVQNWKLQNTTQLEVLDIRKNIASGMYVIWVKNGEKEQYYSKLLIK